MNYLIETEQLMNSLIQEALLQKHCGSCPNLERVKDYSSQGVYPRWAAGYVTAPIVLIFERPGNQHYLCEFGKGHITLAEDIGQFRQNYSQIMYSGYSDGVRYLEAILYFIYGQQAFEFSYHSRIEKLSRLVYITELVKCPGSEKGMSKEIDSICPQSYMKKEWAILQQYSPLLVISTTHLMSRFPSNFSLQVRKMEKIAQLEQGGITYLKVHHPAYVSRFKDNGKLQWLAEWTNTAKKHHLPILTDLGVETDIRKSIYLLHHLESLPNAIELKNSLKKRVQDH